MKKPLVILTLLLLAVILSAGCIGDVYQHTPPYPPMSGLEMVEYSEHIIYSDEPYTIVELTEEIHKENPELAVLIEKMNKTGFDRELGMIDDELSLSLHPDKYISGERGMELWNTYGYGEVLGDINRKRIVLSENGKLYCLIKSNL